MGIFTALRRRGRGGWRCIIMCPMREVQDNAELAGRTVHLFHCASDYFELTREFLQAAQPKMVQLFAVLQSTGHRGGGVFVSSRWNRTSF